MDNHILIGLGGTGGKILREFKVRMFTEYPDKEVRKKLPISVLYVDSTSEDIGLDRPEFNVLGQDAGFTQSEFLNINNNVDVRQLIANAGNHPNLGGIVDNAQAVQSTIGNLGAAAGQKRRAGRLLFANSAERFKTALTNAYNQCATYNDTHNKVVHIFAGLSGGTGSGSVVDAVMQTRKHWPEATILVYAMLPERDLPKAGMDKGRYYPNAYAALEELNAMQAGAWVPTDITGKGQRNNLHSITRHGVANGIAVYSNSNDNNISVDSFTELPRIVSDFAYARIFNINQENQACQDILRAYNFENLDGSEDEYDETAHPSGPYGELPVARTRKVSSFAIKRIVYPEVRVLKHISYTVSDKILNQLRYNNWSDTESYRDTVRNVDWRHLWLDDDHLAAWKLDMPHVTLEDKVLELDPEYPNPYEFWQSMVDQLKDIAWQTNKDTATANIQTMMDDIFNSTYRTEGVNAYFNGKLRVMNELAASIRYGVERDLYSKWMNGEISVTDLSNITGLLSFYVSDDLREKIVKAKADNEALIKDIEAEFDDIRHDWAAGNIFTDLIWRHRKNLFNRYCADLPAYMEARTKRKALEFAEAFQQVLNQAFGTMVEEVARFSGLMGKATEEIRKLIAAQHAIGNSIENPQGALIEVAEDQAMKSYEKQLTLDRQKMQAMSQSVRNKITEGKEFLSFGDLERHISVNSIKNAIDTTMPPLVKQYHDERPASEVRVLGLNVLKQLQQKLSSGTKIAEFAQRMHKHCSPYVKLDNNQLDMNVENNQAPIQGTNTNIRETMIVLPEPDADTEAFAIELRDALVSQTPNGKKPPVVVMDGKRKNELFMVAINSGYPLRAVTWLSQDRRRFLEFINAGNDIQRRDARILMYGEGNGENLPDLFVTDKSKGSDLTPPLPPDNSEKPLHLAVNGVNYGPYDRATCRELVKNKQLTPDTYVWMEGMAAWTPAKDVEELKSLFAPAMPPVPSGMPPIPGAAPQMPPMP